MNWHVQAERLKARFPHKPWRECCQMVAKQRKPKPARISVPAFAAKMEQLNLF